MITERRIRTWFVLSVLGVAAMPLGATAGPAGDLCPPHVTATADGWRQVAAPSFAAGGRSVAAFAVAPETPETIYVTNGTAVSRSTDGGCSWRSAYVLPESPTPPAPFSRDSADIVDVVAARDRTYVLVRDEVGPYVLVSGDGLSWSTATTPPVDTDVTDQPPKLVTDVTGMDAYLVVHGATSLLGTGAGDVILATEDGGETWAARAIGVENGTVAHAQIRDVAVDPLAGSAVWVSTTAGLFHSADGGQTWTVDTPGTTTQLGVLAVMHRPGREVQVVVANAAEPVVHLSGSDGDWITVNTPGHVTSAAGGRTVRQLAIATPAGVYELERASLTWRPIHTGGPLLSRLATDYTGSPSFHACACGTAGSGVWSREPRIADTGPGRDTDRAADTTEGGGDFPGYYGCAPDTKQRGLPLPSQPSTVTPAAHEVTLAPGESATVPYRFHVQPRELDLYFLLDAGPLAQSFGCAATQGAVWAAEELARTRNLRVGLGLYGDFPRTGNPYGLLNCATMAEEPFVYRRDLRIGPVDRAFREAMTGVGAFGCAGDSAGLTALFQSATGTGQDVAPSGPSPFDIRRGQQAGFAPDALKVIVHVAGTGFNAPERSPGYPGVSFETAIRALNTRGIKQVGIAAPPKKKKHHGDDFEPPDTASADLRIVAGATGAVATRPIDCGDRSPFSVARGDPLVCGYVEASADPPDAPPMGAQMISLVGALQDPQPMRLAVLSGDAPFARLAPAAGHRLDHLMTHTLDYSVTYTCRADEVGTVRDVEVGGLVGSSVVATATTTVRCGSQPPPIVAGEFPDVAIAPPLVAPAAPAANPVTNTNPAPNPASQAQAQGQNVPQGAAAVQERAQTRLAYVSDTGQRDELVVEYEMSGLPSRREEAVPVWALSGVAAATTCAVGAFAVRHAHGTTAALVRRRRA